MGPAGYINTILQVLTATISGMKDFSFEQEYLQKGGILHIGRIIEASYLNRQVSSQLSPQADATPATWGKPTFNIEHLVPWPT